MNALVSEVERLIQRHKSCESNTRDALAWTLANVQQALARVRAGEDCASSMNQLSSDIKNERVSKKIGSSTLEYHEAVKIVGKAMENKFHPEICDAARADRLPVDPFNKAILEHLYWQGHFDAGDSLAKECGISDCQESRRVFQDMHGIVQQIQRRQLDNALDWAYRHRPLLSKNNQATHFEFELHRLVYLSTLQEKGALPALHYARQHFDQFKETHMPDIQPLMCCLIYSHKPLAESPYKRFASDGMYAQAANLFVREACCILGQACESPLLVAAAAGSVALPQLLKLIKVTSVPASTMVDLATCEHMPIELELGSEFNFHSIFACPVSREQTDHDNPPKMLPCGHVLCEHTISNISRKNSQHSFKCPYCPIETQASCCRRLTFPDVQ